MFLCLVGGCVSVLMLVPFVFAGEKRWGHGLRLPDNGLETAFAGLVVAADGAGSLWLWVTGLGGIAFSSCVAARSANAAGDCGVAVLHWGILGCVIIQRKSIARCSARLEEWVGS